ncbi:hypothetical protein AgCh_025242 [Apium graveolens]
MKLSTSEEPRTPVFFEDDEFVDNIEKNEEFINLNDDLVDVEDEDDNVEDENELENYYVEDEDDNVADTNMYENIDGGGVPYMNQIFQSLDEAGHFFRAYALRNGFVIKIQATHRNKENEIYGRLHVCRLSGKSIIGESSKNKRRREDEQTSTFQWILHTWLEGVGNKPPMTIITDEDQAMESAIADYHLKEHKWLNGLYELKRKSIIAYTRKTFSAFQNSTSRSEGMNSFFDNYVSSETGLKKFIENAQKILGRQLMREKEEDYVTVNLKRPLKMHTTLKYHGSCIYTKEMFRRFQDELVESSNTLLTKTYELMKMGLKDWLEAARNKEEEKIKFWQKAGAPALALRATAPGEQKVSASALVKRAAVLVKRAAALGRDKQIPILLQFEFWTPGMHGLLYKHNLVSSPLHAKVKNNKAIE